VDAVVGAVSERAGAVGAAGEEQADVDDAVAAALVDLERADPAGHREYDDSGGAAVLRFTPASTRPASSRPATSRSQLAIAPSRRLRPES
jgi:hypothetical protein